MANHKDINFGRIKSPYDSRDYSLRSYMPAFIEIPATTSKNWEFQLESLDQGDTPHCVGFSIASFGINLPTFTPYANEDGHKFYFMCKEYDGYFANEDGTTVRSGAKVMKDIGAIKNYAFAYSVDQIKWWVLNKGPVIIGSRWTFDMMQPDENNIVRSTGSMLGGHAYIINEWREDDYIGIQNSWGSFWGDNGKAYISRSDFEVLFAGDGEALAAVESQSKKRSFSDLIKGFFLSLVDAVVSVFKK